MDEKVNKYIEIIRAAFIIFGILGYLFTLFAFMIGSMDVTITQTERFTITGAIFGISTLFFVIAGIIQIRNKFIWFLATLLSVFFLTIALINIILKGILILHPLILIFQPPTLIGLMSIFVLIILLKPEVRKYYFSKEENIRKIN